MNGPNRLGLRLQTELIDHRIASSEELTEIDEQFRAGGRPCVNANATATAAAATANPAPTRPRGPYIFCTCMDGTC